MIEYARLQVAEGPHRVDRILFEGTPQTTIGRHGSADWQIRDPQISGLHCVLWFDDARLHVRDLGSKNGTRVNGARVAESVLQPGDTIRVGMSRIEVEIVENTEAELDSLTSLFDTTRHTSDIGIAGEPETEPAADPGPTSSPEESGPLGARLDVTAGPHRGLSVPVPEGATVQVGTIEECDLRLEKDRGVARRHLYVRWWSGRLYWRIMDKGKTVLVNRVALSVGGLGHLDVLDLGTTRIQVVVGQEEELFQGIDPPPRKEEMAEDLEAAEPTIMQPGPGPFAAGAMEARAVPPDPLDDPGPDPRWSPTTQHLRTHPTKVEVTVTAGPEQHRTLRLGNPSTTRVGSSPVAELRLGADERLPPIAAQLELLAGNQLVVFPKNQAELWIDGRRIGDCAVWKPGQALRVGHSTLVFRWLVPDDIAAPAPVETLVTAREPRGPYSVHALQRRDGFRLDDLRPLVADSLRLHLLLDPLLPRPPSAHRAPNALALSLLSPEIADSMPLELAAEVSPVLVALDWESELMPYADEVRGSSLCWVFLAEAPLDEVGRVLRRAQGDFCHRSGRLAGLDAKAPPGYFRPDDVRGRAEEELLFPDLPAVGLLFFDDGPEDAQLWLPADHADRLAEPAARRLAGDDAANVTTNPEEAHA